MIQFSEPKGAQLKTLLNNLAEESQEARKVVEEHKEAILADAVQVAKFLELLFPDETITIFSRLYHVIINKNGSIFTFDISSKRCSIFQSWSILEKRSLFEMPPQDRTFLGRQFNWKSHG